MAFFTGLFLGLGLILSIGVQNIFLLKRALKKDYAFTTAFVCFICDVILIGFSILFTTSITDYLPKFKPIMLIVAIVFLFYYGWVSLKSSLGSHDELEAKFMSKNDYTLLKIVVLSMSFSLLNPQAILEIVIILGGVASNYNAGYQELEFMLGASLASFLWFFFIVLLGMYLGKYIKNAKVWSWVERFSALLMFVIAINCGVMLFRF